MPKLSVITVNLNNKTGLEKTFQSLMCQTFNDYEVIVIDGGSSDGSVDVIKHYEPHIRYWVSEPDSGIYNAMNKGILKANGEYCFFLNSGDYLADSNVFTRVLSCKPVEDVLFGNLYVVVNGNVTEKACGKHVLTFSDVFAHTIKHQAAFIKKDLFNRFELYSENLKIVADWEFFIKTVGLRNSSYRYFDVFISYFDNDGISNRNKDLCSKERQQVINEYVPLMMHQDYEFMLKYKKYKRVYENRITFFLVRLINKIYSFFL